jgi:hypothetical protein
MPVDHFRYDLLTQDALRGVMRVVLTDVAVNGLPGDHHFYITFDTRAEGVRLSARLKASYPEEMTIVLQHQFWDLAVGEDDFDVGLAFNGIPERLHIPFRTVKAFIDPSVQYALQFVVESEGRPDTVAAETHPESAPPAADEPQVQPLQVQPKTEPAQQIAGSGEPFSKEEGSAEVVRLDRFRKK